MGKNLITPFVVAAVLLLAATAAFAAHGASHAGDHAGDHAGASGGKGGAKFAASKGQATEDESALGRLNANAQNQGFQRAMNAKLFDRFTQSGNTVQGRFVSFTSSGSSIDNFRVSNGTGNLTLFNTMSIGNGEISNSRVTGSVWRASGENLSVSVHNNPTALMQVRASSNFTGQIVFGIPQTVTMPANQNTRVDGLRLNIGPNHWHIMTMGNTTLDYNQTGHVYVNFTGEGGLVVRNHPLQTTLFTGTLHEVNKAIQTGKAGAILNVVNAGGQPLQAGESFGVLAKVKSLQTDGVTVTVSSDEPAGKIIILNLDAQVTNNITDPSRIKVSLDGSQVQMETLGTVDTFLNSTTARAKVMSSVNGTQVWVYVPGFSEHDITVQGTETTSGGNNNNNDTGGNQNGGSQDDRTPGFGVVALLAAAAVGVLVMRRRRA